MKNFKAKKRSSKLIKLNSTSKQNEALKDCCASSKAPL